MLYNHLILGAIAVDEKEDANCYIKSHSSFHGARSVVEKTKAEYMEQFLKL